MAIKGFVAACSVIAACVSSSAIAQPAQGGGAPAADANARYCMRVEPIVGSNVQTVQCWTRAEWLEQGVDVDKWWAKEGVAVIR